MTDEPRIDRVTGEYERKGTCKACGRKMRQSKTIKAPTFELMELLAEEWGKSLMVHRKCPR